MMRETLDPAKLLARYGKAKERRGRWESHWQECFDYALPQRNAFTRDAAPGEKKTDRLFDGTAADAVDQLAASLLGQLTPPWSRWFAFNPGPDLDEREREEISPLLDEAAARLKSHFERSNFAVEIHQCYLDLVTGGTACLMVEEAEPGAPSALNFTAVPLSEAILEEGAQGRLDVTFRASELTLARLESRFPAAEIPPHVKRRAEADAEARFKLVEAVLPEGAGYRYAAVLDEGGEGADGALLLAEGVFSSAPFINFRWLKAPGEIYGRSPVMKALPDIKTANKVVELVLKNASIAVTGIWQADDDGVLNPANIRLVPGAIIPKAVGSAGLTPLEAPGRFDISELVLEDLRARIRHALLVDRLDQANTPKMTATEVLERADEMNRLLGATFGRLQSELLTPLINRAVDILHRRGEIPDLQLDGRIVELQYQSPLARLQAQADVHGTVLWVEQAAALGPEALAVVDLAAAARWVGRALGVPAELIRETAPAPVPAPEQEIPVPEEAANV